MDSELNYHLEMLLESSNDINDVIFQIDFMNFENDNLSLEIFVKIIDSFLSFPIVKQVENQSAIVKKMIERGLNLNIYPTKSSFSYGHLVMRHSPYELVQLALDSGFKFNSYTTNKWHSLELLQINCLGLNDEKPELLNIIENQLKKGIDLSKSNPTDFFKKLDQGKKNKGWFKLIDIYLADKYMKKFIIKNINIIADNNLLEYISKDIKDIFLF